MFKKKTFGDEKMADYISRPRALGEYIVRHKTTVRDTAKAFGVSKSTVHTDVTVKLRKTDPVLAGQVRSVLDLNKEQRHIRGGIATKEKYMLLREKVTQNDE